MTTILLISILVNFALGLVMGLAVWENRAMRVCIVDAWKELHEPISAIQELQLARAIRQAKSREAREMKERALETCYYVLASKPSNEIERAGYENAGMGIQGRIEAIFLPN